MALSTGPTTGARLQSFGLQGHAPTRVAAQGRHVSDPPLSTPAETNVDDERAR